MFPICFSKGYYYTWLCIYIYIYAHKLFRAWSSRQLCWGLIFDGHPGIGREIHGSDSKCRLEKTCNKSSNPQNRRTHFEQIRTNQFNWTRPCASFAFDYDLPGKGHLAQIISEVHLALTIPWVCRHGRLWSFHCQKVRTDAVFALGMSSSWQIGHFSMCMFLFLWGCYIMTYNVAYWILLVVIVQHFFIKRPTNQPNQPNQPKQPNQPNQPNQPTNQ